MLAATELPIEPVAPKPHASVKERARAERARAVHVALGHPSDHDLCVIAREGLIEGINIDVPDIALAGKLLGPCASCLQGKCERPRRRPRYAGRLPILLARSCTWI